MQSRRFYDGGWWWVAVMAACALAFALRLLAANGALWTDEAWSMVYAEQARTPAGVFLRINHDNNHHLYSLWLQAVGRDAAPLLARLPAVIAGTLTVLVAAVFAGRHSRAAGVVAALLFAVSPTLVTFGSEARGYAPMLLAAMVLMLLASDAIDRKPTKPAAPWLLALTAALGMLSHLTMAAPVALATLWVYLDRRTAVGPDHALRETARLFGPALLATAAVIGLVFAAAAASPTGMRLGGYLPFDWGDYGAALGDLATWTAGLALPLSWLGPLLVALAACWVALKPPLWVGSRARLYAILILAVPLGAALLQPGNAGFARYYLASALGLLLLLAEGLGRAIAQAGWRRGLAIVALALITGAGLWRGAQLIELGRGRPDRAAALIGAGPVALQPVRFEAALSLAAARRGEVLNVARGCAPAKFVLAAAGRLDRPAEAIARCGIRYRRIASAGTTPLSGDGWTLYAATRLQTREAPVSGRAPQAAAVPPPPAERA
jgi:hypothetical protein